MRGPARTAPRIAERSAEFYRANFGNLNAGAEYTLDAFPGLYRRTMGSLRGRFTRGELSLILDISNGLSLTAGIAGQHLGLQVADGIALDALDTKWGVDAHTLLGKIAGLTVFEAACLEIWGRAYWMQETHDLEAYVGKMEGEKYEPLTRIIDNKLA